MRRSFEQSKTPTTKNELQQILGLFSYYSKSVPYYSALIRLLVQIDSFLLSKDVLIALRVMKYKLSQGTLQPFDKNLPFIIETNASDFAIAATLNQNNKPVVFHAHTLSLVPNKSIFL